MDTFTRREMLGMAGGAIAAASLGRQGSAAAQTKADPPAAGIGPLQRVRAGELEVGYHASGPAEGDAVILLHGFPYDVTGFAEVAPALASRGRRVIVPHLRGHGPTRFLDPTTPRSGQQAALGVDLESFMDALQIPRAVLAGYDWGGRAACVAAALWPQRCTGLVSVNGYLIQDIASAGKPLSPAVESGLWYQFYFQTERGRTGLEMNRKEIARTLWSRNSPTWNFTEAAFEQSAVAFENPDYVDVVIHSYRHRLGLAPGMPQFEGLERRLAALPRITVPTITLDGAADGVVPATDGSSSAARFSGPRKHRVVSGAGHNLPQEAPEAFANAVLEVSTMS